MRKKHKQSDSKKKKLVGNIAVGLKKAEFLSVATSNVQASPHVSAKAVIKFKNTTVYLIDQIYGGTCKNVESNPSIALSYVDREKQLVYILYGRARLLMKGKEYAALVGAFEKKKVQLITSRVIEGVKRKKQHEKFDLVYLKPKVIIKVKIRKIVKITLQGTTEERDIK